MGFAGKGKNHPFIAIIKLLHSCSTGLDLTHKEVFMLAANIGIFGWILITVFGIIPSSISLFIMVYGYGRMLIRFLLGRADWGDFMGKGDMYEGPGYDGD